MDIEPTKWILDDVLHARKRTGEVSLDDAGPALDRALNATNAAAVIALTSDRRASLVAVRDALIDLAAAVVAMIEHIDREIEAAGAAVGGEP